MNSWVFLACCVLLLAFSLATGGSAQCVRMEGRTDSQTATLRKQLLCNYDTQTAPVNASDGDSVAVKTVLYRYRVEYKTPDTWASVNTYNMLENSPNWFTINTYVFLTWQDSRLKWNATDHNNQTRIHFDLGEVWSPDVDIRSSFPVIFAKNDGTVESFYWANLIGNCRPIYFRWGDQRECVLSFRVNPEDKVKLIRDTEQYAYDYRLSKSGTWSVINAKRVFPLKEGEKNEDFERIHKERPWKYGPGYFETSVTIQRNFAVEDATIFTPAAILAVLLVSSTWIPAMNASRVGMLSMIVVVQVFMFHQACRTMPFLPYRVADIVALYQDLILCSGAAIIEWLVAYNIATQRAPLPESLGRMALPSPFSFPFLKSIFVISEKGSRSIEIAALLDRMAFLVLTIISFILVVVLAKRPPMVPLDVMHAI